MASTSLFSIGKLFRNFRLVSISLPGMTLELAKELEADETIGKKVESLASHFDIDKYDFKSNLLLLRLKIENQLRELIRMHDIPMHKKTGSLYMLSNKLYEKRILEKNLVSLIREISPAMNRELHEASSYLTNDEFEMLQHAAMSAVAALDKALENRQKST